MITFICFLEKLIERYKRKYVLKSQSKFLRKYHLADAEMHAKTKQQYNPYQPTGTFLIDALIKKNYIKKEDYVLDVGSGTGLFLLYLASQGFKHLNGIEIDNAYYDISIQNLAKIPLNADQHVDIACGDVFDTAINDEINVFYLFNTFYDKETYLSFLSAVKESLIRNPREIKIIILFPTISSMSALKETEWLHQIGRVMHRAQACYRCNYFLIYSNEEN